MAGVVRVRSPRPDDMPDSVRMRVFVDGALVDEAWVDESNAEAISKRQSAAVEACHGDGLLVEVFDPDLSGPDAFLLFGTTSEGMRNPEILGRGDDPATERAIVAEYRSRVVAARRYT